MKDGPIEIVIDMDRKCKKCGHRGAMQSGLCLRCVAVAMRAAADRKRSRGKTIKHG